MYMITGCVKYNSEYFLFLMAATYKQLTLHAHITYLRPYILRAASNPGQYARNTPKHVSDISPKHR